METVVIYLIAVMVGLLVHIGICYAFSTIANEKGYTGYFWWCFGTGPCGWAMVIALPDRGRQIPDYTKQLKELQELLTAANDANAAKSAAVYDDSLPEL